MQDDQTTEAVNDLIKEVENSDSSTSSPTLADNPLAQSPSTDQSSPDSPKTSKAEETAPESGAATEQSSAPAETSAASSPSASSSGDDTLDPIKKEALKKLEPLVSELDLNPEEKYRALMMIIQATDNKELVNEAYQAADKIEDTKVRAQALLSIINEIDYFKNKETVSS